MAAELPSPIWEDKNKLHSTSGCTSVSQSESECRVIQRGKSHGVEVLVLMILLIDRNKCRNDDTISGSLYHLSLAFTKQHEMWYRYSGVGRDTISSTVKLLDLFRWFDFV